MVDFKKALNDRKDGNLFKTEARKLPPLHPEFTRYENTRRLKPSKSEKADLYDIDGDAFWIPRSKCTYHLGFDVIDIRTDFPESEWWEG